jgi:hypothetical protein
VRQSPPESTPPLLLPELLPLELPLLLPELLPLELPLLLPELLPLELPLLLPELLPLELPLLLPELPPLELPLPPPELLPLEPPLLLPELLPLPLPESLPLLLSMVASGVAPASSVFWMGVRSLEQMRCPLVWGTQSRLAAQSVAISQGAPCPPRVAGELQAVASATVPARVPSTRWSAESRMPRIRSKSTAKRPLRERDQGIALVDGLGLGHVDLLDLPRAGGLDRHFHLHRLQDDEHLPLGHLLALLDLDLPNSSGDMGVYALGSHRSGRVLETFANADTNR